MYGKSKKLNPKASDEELRSSTYYPSMPGLLRKMTSATADKTHVEPDMEEGGAMPSSRRWMR